MHAAASLHPPALMKRYDFTDGAAIKHAVHAFIGACQTSQRSAVQMYRQRPSADTSTRRFQPASELASSVDAEPEKPTDAARGPEKLTEKLLELGVLYRPLHRAQDVVALHNAMQRFSAGMRHRSKRIFEHMHATTAPEDLTSTWDVDQLLRRL